MHAHHHRSIKGISIALVGFAVAAAIFLMLYQYAIAAQWDSMLAMRSQIRELRKSLADTTAPIILEKRLAALHDSLEYNLKEISREFGDTKDLSAILRMLVEKANAADIRFVKMQPTSEGVAAKTGAYPIILEMTAPYHSLGRFVAALEAVPNLAHVDRVAITATQKSLLSIRLQVTCYIQKNG